jgi:predicted PurR-regulated permease PerM
MENLQLIMVTVLITLISGALVGSLIYFGVVVRNLRRTVKDNVVDITDLQNSLNNEVINIYNRIDDVEKSLDQKLNDLDSTIGNAYSELDRKIDSRYDKLVDNISRDMEILRQTKTK